VLSRPELSRQVSIYQQDRIDETLTEDREPETRKLLEYRELPFEACLEPLLETLRTNI
jgi:hypothetical protein